MYHKSNLQHKVYTKCDFVMCTAYNKKVILVVYVGLTSAPFLTFFSNFYIINNHKTTLRKNNK